MKSAAVETKRTTKIQDATRVAGIQLTIVEAESDQMTFLKPGSKAWAEAWKGLLLLAGCVVARSSDTGDRWEYVGTYRGYHEFRHRAHPGAGNQRLYARVPVDDCNGPGSVWAGSPYPDDVAQVQVRKDCPLKTLFRPGDG